jgi:hypothetical protein
VTCVGPAAALAALYVGSAAAEMHLSWAATATVDADRDSAPKSFTGSESASLAER